MTMESSLLSTLRENHIFSSNSEDLESIGLHSFTLKSCKTKWNNNLENIKMILGISYGELSTDETVIDLINGELLGTYIFYDGLSSTRTESKIPYNTIVGYINYYENRIKDPDNTPENINIDLIIKSIKKAGGIVFTFNRSSLSTYTPRAGEPTKINIVLKFLDRKENEKDDRTLGIDLSSTSFAGIPTTMGGTQYRPNTEPQLNTNEQATLQAPFTEGPKDPRNKTAAKIHMTYNRTTGEWSAGSHRVIARMVTNVDAAQIQKITPDQATVKDASEDDFYGPGGVLNSRVIPATGEAIILEVQGNDPMQFGPTFVLKCDGTRDTPRPETVTVTNRTPVSYKAGEPVFLTYMAPEWVIEKMPEATNLSDPLQIGEWAFCKLIANSDHYFRSKQSYLLSDDRVFTPSFYENYMYFIFNRVFIDYQKVFQSANAHCWNEYLDLNILSKTEIEGDAGFSYFYTSDGYYTHSTIDNIRDICKTSTQTKNFEGGPYAEEVGVFWGPVYIDGYRTIKKLEDEEFAENNAKTFFNNFATIDYAQFEKIDNPIIIMKGKSKLSLSDVETEETLQTDVGEDGRLLPNGQTREVKVKIPIYNPTNNDIPAELTSRIMGIEHQNEGNIFYPPTFIRGPYADSDIINNNNIQFIPLAINILAHNDDKAMNLDLYDKNFKTNFDNWWKNSYVNAGSPPNLWTKMFERLRQYKYSPSLNGPLGATLGSNCGKFYNVSDLVSKSIVAYDCYISAEPVEVPVGNPRGLFNDGDKYRGANCVGIICGKNTITKRSGGAINFEVKSNFGLPVFRTSSGGVYQLNLMILGGIPIPFLNQNEVKNLPGIPQYGSKSDEIYSFGTTALFVRIFDSWPEELTVFNPRYFSVVHFNPGNRQSVATTTTRKINNIDYIVDNIDYANVDFRIPSYISQNQMLPIPLGTKISQDGVLVQVQVPKQKKDANGNPMEDEDGNPVYETEEVMVEGLLEERLKYETLDIPVTLAPANAWKVNTSRRGVLLVQGRGFIYSKNMIGLPLIGGIIKVGPRPMPNNVVNPKYKFSGKKYKKGSVYDIQSGAKIKITKVSNDGAIEEFEVLERGEFTTNVFPLEKTLPLPTDDNGSALEGGETATLIFPYGVVYSKKLTDLPPKEHAPLTRLSSSSRSGQEIVSDETLNTSFTLEKNSTGKYDIFTHFHNDVSHTLWTPTIGAWKEKLQYINMKIT